MRKTTPAPSQHIIAQYGIKTLKSSHAAVRKLKQTKPQPSLHGHKIWPSSFVLMDYLQKEKLSKNTHVIDIGCGWGVLSCFLAAKCHAKVVGVDADKDIEPYFKLTTQINNIEIPFVGKRFEKLTGDYLSRFDILTGCDICFWDDMVNPLYNLIRRGLRNGINKIYITDPGRTSFWLLADRCTNKLNAEVISHKARQIRTPEKYILIITADD